MIEFGEPSLFRSKGNFVLKGPVTMTSSTYAKYLTYFSFSWYLLTKFFSFIWFFFARTRTIPRTAGEGRVPPYYFLSTIFTHPHSKVWDNFWQLKVLQKWWKMLCSYRSQNIYIFILTFWSCRKTATTWSTINCNTHIDQDFKK